MPTDDPTILPPPGPSVTGSLRIASRTLTEWLPPLILYVQNAVFVPKDFKDITSACQPILAYVQKQQARRSVMEQGLAQARTLHARLQGVLDGLAGNTVLSEGAAYEDILTVHSLLHAADPESIHYDELSIASDVWESVALLVEFCLEVALGDDGARDLELTDCKTAMATAHKGAVPFRSTGIDILPMHGTQLAAASC